MITVSSNRCGGRWSLPAPAGTPSGSATRAPAAPRSVDPASGAVYAEIENTGPGTVNPITIDFGSGRYALLCLFNDFSPLQGTTVIVAGHAAGTRAAQPVTDNDLIPYAKRYVTQQEAAIKVLDRATAALDAAVRSGNTAAAKRDWLTAHLQYETLGDAYSAFGDFDTSIDGRADATGVGRPQWTGFLRLGSGCGTGSPGRW